MPLDRLNVDALEVSGFSAIAARSDIPLAAILMPAGFFRSATGAQRSAPNRLIALIYLGAASLAVGVVTIGLELLTA